MPHSPKILNDKESGYNSASSDDETRRENRLLATTSATGLLSG